jgi:CheY-like chemotaxis protein
MRIAATVELNLEPPCGFRGEETEELTHAAVSGRGPRCGRVLIMDDDRLVREMMHRQLAICGYEVTAAVHGEEAVSAYRRAQEAGRPFNAVILDLLVANGWGGERTLAELLRLDPGVKALVCSGTLAESRVYYEKKGFRGVLGKPFTLAELRGELEGVLLSPDCG